MKAAKGKHKEKEERYDLITTQEMEARKQVYLMRLTDVHLTSQYMLEAVIAYENIQKQDIITQKWERYLSCDGIPKPYKVPHIRTFESREKYFEEINEDKTIDWRIGIDERSILTQNIFRKDLTRDCLKKEKCPNIGLFYQNIIGNYLETLKRVDILLDNDVEMLKYSLKIARDIVELKTELEEEIEEIFDRYVYRIINADTAYMKSLDGRVEKYGYKGDSFNIDLWALCNVPVRFKEFEIPVMTASLDYCQVEVQIPLSVLSQCLTLRCIHKHFDHFSSKAKSYEQLVTVPTDNLNAGIPDLEDCLINEWTMQTDILADITYKMKSKIADYEEAKQNAEQAAIDAKKKGKDDNKKAQKLPKVPKAPQDLPEGMLPDTLPLFLKEEQSQWVEFLNEFYHPITLNLEDDEINLKDYIMLGGVYSLHFVDRPKHFLFNEFNVTSHSKDRKLHIFADLVADLRYWDKESSESDTIPLPKRSSRFGSKRETMASESRADMRKRIQKSISRFELDLKKSFAEMNVLPFFHVKFKLPKHLCLWGEPKVCHFEECDEEVSADKPEIAESVLKEFSKKKTDKQFSLESTSEKRLKRNRGSMDEQRRTGSTNVFRPTLSVILRNTKVVNMFNPITPVSNFKLDTNLTKTNIRNLAKHCLPRILSSFHFPMETRDSANEAEELKMQRNVLVRKVESANDADDNVMAKCDFNYEEQLNPERFFPVFEYAENVDYLEEIHFSDDEEPKTFYSLVQRFNGIKKKYLSKNRELLSQDYRIKFPSEKKIKSQFNIPTNRTISSRDNISRISLPTTASKTRFSTEQQLSSFSLFENMLSIEDFEVKKTFSFSKENEKAKAKEKPKMIKLKHWTTKHITSSVFNKEDNTLLVYTDRLGIFGLAYKRYEHFPFRFWSLQPNPDNEGEIIFSLDTQNVRVIIYISSNGYRGYATDITNEYVVRPVKYINIEKPISDYNEFKKYLRDNNINIFANHDAGFYIEKGYFSQKHLSTELHTYIVMAMHCMLLNFFHSSWNRLATRRNIVLCIKGRRDDDEKLNIRITPELSTFVEIRELCSDDLDIFNLEYIPTWRNLQTYTDLNYLIYSIYPHAQDVRNKDYKLFIFLKKLLADVRPLSYA